MEEDNLFLIKHVAEEDQSLDELKKMKEHNIREQQKEIEKAEKSIKDLKENTRELFQRDSAVEELHKRMQNSQGEKEQEQNHKEMIKLEKKVREIYQQVLGKKPTAGDENDQRSILGMLETIENRIEYYLQAREDLKKASDKSQDIKYHYDLLEKDLKAMRKQR